MTSPFAYTIHTPASMKPGITYPVVFALHGIGYTEKDMISVIEELNEKLIVIGVRGQRPYENGYAYYYLKGYGNPEREQFDESVGMLDRFIDYAANRYPIDRERMYLLGFSQGAILSLTLALRLGKKNKGRPCHERLHPILRERRVPDSIDGSSVRIPVGRPGRSYLPPHIGEESYQYLKERVGSIRYQTYAAAHEISDANREDAVAWIRMEVTR